MWLHDTSSLELCEFLSAPPPYAILSHTWADEEISFQELTDATLQDEANRKAGYRKIKRFCTQARLDGLKYAWVDTSCIDKRSSAELSEAINSMYRWYSEAQVCYTYLSDVSTLISSENLSMLPDKSYPRPVWGLLSSRWMRRGWTLQELIAPAHVVFYDVNWLEIGTKASMLDDLHEITGIPRRALMQPQSIRENSVAEKMSWASARETTRTEDMAYCLLGIFDVNMPLLYGEGKKAFHRLQLQILGQSSDHSIFAWTIPDSWSHPAERHGLSVFADSPVRFSIDAAGPIVQGALPSMMVRNEINITNLGVSITLPVIQDSGAFVAILNCERQGHRIGIAITPTVLGPPGAWESSCRARLYPQKLFFVNQKIVESARPKNIYMLTKVPDPFPKYSGLQIELSMQIDGEQKGHSTLYTSSWSITKKSSSEFSYAGPSPAYTQISNYLPVHNLSPVEYKSAHPLREDEWRAFTFSSSNGKPFALIFGSKNGRVWCHCIVGAEALQIDKLGPPDDLYKALASNSFTMDTWRYFQDRVSYKLDQSSMMHVAIKFVAASPLPGYKIEIILEQRVAETTTTPNSTPVSGM